MSTVKNNDGKEASRKLLTELKERQKLTAFNIAMIEESIDLPLFVSHINLKEIAEIARKDKERSDKIQEEFKIWYKQWNIDDAAGLHNNQEGTAHDNTSRES